MAKDNTLGSILCPNCGKLISANAEKCIHCGARKPNLMGIGTWLRKFFGGQTSLIPFIIAACIALYALSLLLDPSAIFGSGGFLSFLSPSLRSLFKLGVTGSVPMASGRWWTPITAIYLHGSLLHILFNVLWIRQIGPLVEDLYGVARGFLIFTISGIAGFVLSVYAGNQFTLGASGAIFGLLGALIHYGRKRGGAFGTAVYRQMGQWAIILFIFGFLFPRIDNFAHFGGFVGGYATAALFGYIELKRDNRTHLTLAAGAIGLTVIAFLLTLVS